MKNVLRFRHGLLVVAVVLLVSAFSFAGFNRHAPTQAAIPGVVIGIATLPDDAALRPDIDVAMLRHEISLATIDNKRRRLGATIDIDQPLKWQRLATGEGPDSWRTEIMVKDATFLRARFVTNTMPPDMAIFVYADPSGPIHRINQAWTPMTAGDRLFIEVVTADEMEPTLRIDRVAVGAVRLSGQSKESWCYLDSSCYDAWTDEANALVHLTFTSGEEVYECSSALVMDEAATFTPWVLTASHCVSTEDEATSLQATFFYHSPACNSGPPDFFSLPSVLGATIKFTNALYDATLLRLSTSAPNDVSYLGWTLADNAVDTHINVLHHPDGAYARITFGSIINVTEGLLYTVKYTESSTEGGSSGAPLLNDDGRLIGVLSSGTASCDDMNGVDDFMQFSAIWDAGAKAVLGDGGGDDDDASPDDDDTSPDDDDTSGGDDDNDDGGAPIIPDDDDDESNEPQAKEDSGSGGMCG